MKPLLLVSTVAPPIVVVFRLPAVAAAGLLVLVLPLPLLVEDVPDELHAASTAAAAATAGSARNICRRAGLLLIRCAPPMLPRPGIVRVLMTSCPLCRVSVPGQPDGMGGNDCLAGQPAPSAAVERFSAGIATCLFVLSSLPFPWITGAKDKHACFADAHEHCLGLSAVKRLARPHMNLGI